MTLVSCVARSSRPESTITARCTTVSTRSRRTSLPITDWRVSACTKSMSSLAEMGSSTSQPKRDGTRGARRRATSAPRGLETPVMRTREGEVGVTPRLWVDSPYARGVGHALHGQRVSREPHVDVLVHRRVQDLVERARDHVVQLGIDLLLLPEEGLEVLHPLQVRHDHPAGVGDEVWHPHDAPLAHD